MWQTFPPEGSSLDVNLKGFRQWTHRVTMHDLVGKTKLIYSWEKTQALRQ